ncbi:MAG: four-helix bundle copper-binding protein [Fibrobacteria bacterium]
MSLDFILPVPETSNFKLKVGRMKISENAGSMKSTIAAVTECAQACRACASACLGEKNIDMLRECIRLDLDCAGVCDLAADFMLRGSPFHGQVCEVCADICDACAAECGKHKRMKHCQECAEACRRCAEACRSMAESMV